MLTITLMLWAVVGIVSACCAIVFAITRLTNLTTKFAEGLGRLISSLHGPLRAWREFKQEWRNPSLEPKPLSKPPVNLALADSALDKPSPWSRDKDTIN